MTRLRAMYAHALTNAAALISDDEYGDGTGTPELTIIFNDALVGRSWPNPAGVADTALREMAAEMAEYGEGDGRCELVVAQAATVWRRVVKGRRIAVIPSSKIRGAVRARIFGACTSLAA